MSSCADPGRPTPARGAFVRVHLVRRRVSHPAIAVADRGAQPKGYPRASWRPFTPDPIGSGSIDQIRVKWPRDPRRVAAYCLSAVTTKIGWRRRLPKDLNAVSRRPGRGVAGRSDRNQLEKPVLHSETRAIPGTTGVRWRVWSRSCRTSLRLFVVMIGTSGSNRAAALPGRTHSLILPTSLNAARCQLSWD